MKRFGIIVAMLVSMLVSMFGSAFAQGVYSSYPGNTQRVYTAQNNTYQGRVATVANNAAATLKDPQTILNELKAANSVPADLAPKIQVVKSDTLNAATNGQNIIITDELLSRLKTNDQRAFVIAHELAHITLQHIGKTQFRRVGLSILDQFLLRRYVAEGSMADMAAKLGINLYDKRSGRVYEYQADEAGIRLMANTGYNPQAAIQVFQILQAATPGTRTPEFLQDHPITESRIRALVQKYNLSLQ